MRNLAEKSPLPSWIGKILQCFGCKTRFQLDSENDKMERRDRGNRLQTELNFVTECPSCHKEVYVY
jgi:hypothetical protein